MADNVVANAGSGGSTFATDDIGGVHYPRTKLSVGADGSAADVSTSNPMPVADQDKVVDNAAFTDGTTKLEPAGFVFDETAGTSLTENDAAAARVDSKRAQVLVLEDETTRGRRATVTAANALKVDNSGVTQPVSAASLPLPSGAATAANQSTANTSLSTIAGAVSGVEMQVDVVAALPAGTNNIGDVDIASIAAGDNNIGNVDVVTMPSVTLNALPAGTNNIGDVDVLTLPGSITGKAEDAVAASGDVGVPVLGVRNDAAASRTSDDGDYGMLALDSAGRVGISDLGGAISIDDNGSSITVDGTVAVSGTVTVGSHAVTNAGTFATQVDGAALTALQLIDNVVVVEDAAHSSGDSGVMALAVRRDANTTLADTTGDYAPLQVDASGSLKVAIISGAGSGGTSATDDAAFSVASGSGTPIMGLADETTPDAVDEGDVGVVRMTLQRGLHVNLRDASGNEVSVGGGTQYDEDSAHVSGDKLTLAGAVRRDTAASGCADGDRATINVDGSGKLWTNAEVTVALPAGDNNIGNVDLASAIPAGTNNIGDVDVASIAAGDNNIGNVDIVTMPNVTLAASTNTIEVVGDVAHDAAIAGNPITIGGRASAAAPTDVSADDDAVRAWYLRNGAAASVLTAAGALIGGDATNGLDVDITRIAAGDNNIGNVDIVTMPNVTLAAGTNTNEVVGDAAHDAAIAGNPVRIAGRAVNADYTAVATGDTADFITDLNGKQVVLPYAIPENFKAGATAAITGTSNTEVIAAQGSGVRLYITHIMVTNSHATVSTVVEIKDGTTVIYRGYALAAGGGFCCTLPTPLKLTANTALNAANVTTGSNTYVSASGYAAP